MEGPPQRGRVEKPAFTAGFSLLKGDNGLTHPSRTSPPTPVRTAALWGAIRFASGYRAFS
jgi:hypothetical protein